MGIISMWGWIIKNDEKSLYLKTCSHAEVLKKLCRSSTFQIKSSVLGI